MNDIGDIGRNDEIDHLGRVTGVSVHEVDRRTVGTVHQEPVVDTDGETRDTGPRLTQGVHLERVRVQVQVRFVLVNHSSTITTRVDDPHGAGMICLRHIGESPVDFFRTPGLIHLSDPNRLNHSLPGPLPRLRRLGDPVIGRPITEDPGSRVDVRRRREVHALLAGVKPEGLGILRFFISLLVSFHTSYS